MLSGDRWRIIILAALAGIVVAALLPEPESEENYGYSPNRGGTAAFLRELKDPYFRQAGSEAIAKATGRNTMLYRAALAAHQERYGRPFVVGQQGIGDCVSWGWAMGVWVAQSVDWEDGRLAEPPLMPATESIYGGSRVEARGKNGDGRSAVGGYSDGSYGGAAARWVNEWGVVYREPQDRDDLTTYSADRAKKWGAYGNGGEGDDGQLDEAAKAHPCQHVALVTNFEEAAAAIESGFPVPVCSMAGFSSTRGEHGFAHRSGSWAHCMCFVAVRYGSGDDGRGEADNSGRKGLLCINSWGPTWIDGPKWPADMPEGSFWVDENVVNEMLRGEDSFAVGSVDGFGWRDLHHGEWMDEGN